MYLTYEESEKLFKQIKEDLKHPVELVPTSKLQEDVKKIRKDNQNVSLLRCSNCFNEYKSYEEDWEHDLCSWCGCTPYFVKEIFTEANEYDVDKIKRKLDMFLKTNNIEYLGKARYLTKELIKENI